MRIYSLAFSVSILLGAFLPGANTASHARQAPSLSPRVDQKQRRRLPDVSITHPFVGSIPIPPPAFRTIKKADGTEDDVLRPLQDGRSAPKDSWGRGQHAMLIAEEIYNYLTPPQSLTLRDSSSAVYDREINHPLCIARSETTDWIGTSIGVKCVDRNTKTVRIFADTNNLPTGRVEAIATDETGDGAVVLVRHPIHLPSSDSRYPQPKDEYLLCLWETKSKHWRVLDTLPLQNPDSPGYPQGATREQMPANGYRLLLTEDHAVVLPSEVSTVSKSPFAAYDRATGKRVSVPWDDFVRSDFDALHISGAVRTGETLYLATNLGLLRYDLAAHSWQRLLPSQSISQIAAHPRDKDTVVIQYAPRKVTGSWMIQISRFSLKMGTTTGASLPLPSNRQNHPEIGLLSLAPDGTFWLTYSDTFYATDSERKTWHKVAIDGTETAPDAETKDATLPPFFELYNYAIPTIASVDKLPDEAILPHLLPSSTASLPPNAFIQSHSYMIWQRQRFPFWLSPDNIKGRRAKSFDQSRYAYGFIPDPFDGRVSWGLQDGKLIRLPSRAVPPLRFAPNYSYPDVTQREYLAFNPLSANTSLERFDIFDPQSARRGDHISLNVADFAPIPGAENAVYILSGGDVVRYDSTSDTSTKLRMPDKQVFHNFSDRFLSARRTIMLSNSDLYRLPQDGTDIELIRHNPGRFAHHISQAGAWFDKGSAIEFLPLDQEGVVQGDWQTFDFRAELEKWDGTSDARFVAATGSIAWFQTNGADSLIGYDIAKHEWTKPFRYPASRSPFFLSLTETPEGGAIASIPASDSQVYQFRPTEGEWKPLVSVPASVEKEKYYRVAQAQDGRLYLVTSKSVGTYDPQSKSWAFLPLPEPFQNSPVFDYNLQNIRVLLTKEDFYAGGADVGAWRWNSVDDAWHPIQKKADWSPSQKSGDAYSLTGVAASTDAVWAFGNGTYNKFPVLIRWDRKSRKAGFISAQEAGLPLQLDQQPYMIGVGETVLLWVPGKSGVYRAEPGSVRFQRLSDHTIRAAQTAPDDPNTVYWVTDNALYRYNEKTKQTTSYPLHFPVEPNTRPYGTQRTAYNLVVTKDAVYIATQQGAFRFDRITNNLTIVPHTNTIPIARMQREGDTLVLGSENATVQIKL